MAELRLDAGSLQAANVTRVSVDADGVVHDLVLNPFTGTFDASLFLSAGSHTLVGRAFSGLALVGQSAPVTAAITTGDVTRVELRILDLTDGDQDIFGPLFASLTFPTSALEQQAVAFAASVLAPAGDPVTYAWSSDCPDATFSAPSAPATTWVKPTAGSCTVSVTGTSNGFAVARHFLIVVFPAGTGTGAAEVSGAFITHPTINIFFSELGCFRFGGLDDNATCTSPIAAPTVTSFNLSVPSWGGGTPGLIDIADSCGGSGSITSRFGDSANGLWLPPAAGGLCILTLRATNGDGVVGTKSMAVLASPGTAPPLPPPPEGFASVSGCFLETSQEGADCGGRTAGSPLFLNAQLAVFAGHPGRITLTDTCVGVVPMQGLFNTFLFQSWNVANATPGTTCKVTLRAATLEGSSLELSGHYQVF
jgi:hypothetical protein